MNNLIEENTMQALKIWWALTWRALPIAFIGGFIIGVIIGIIGYFVGVGQNTVSYFSMFFGALFGVYATVLVIKRLMIKGFGQYRIALVEKD